MTADRRRQLNTCVSHANCYTTSNRGTSVKIPRECDVTHSAPGESGLETNDTFDLHGFTSISDEIEEM